MIKSYRYDALNSGKHLVVFGAVHGDEKCGTEAIMRLIEQIDRQEITLKQGTLTCVPICNPEAYKQNKRFYQRNLNRALYIKDHPKYYEDFIDPILCHILDQADILLDLHSYASEGREFGFMGHNSQEEIDYCLSLQVQNFVYGWSDAFGKALDDPREAYGTVEYARSKGALATTIECGQHLNEDAADIGYRTIIQALQHFNMIDSLSQRQPLQHNFAKMEQIFFKEKEGETAKPWKHYDLVSKGDILAIYDDGEHITAPEDGMIILPKLHAKLGGEWFYFARKTDCPAALK